MRSFVRKWNASNGAIPYFQLRGYRGKKRRDQHCERNDRLLFWFGQMTVKIFMRPMMVSIGYTLRAYRAYEAKICPAWLIPFKVKGVNSTSKSLSCVLFSPSAGRPRPFFTLQPTVVPCMLAITTQQARTAPHIPLFSYVKSVLMVERRFWFLRYGTFSGPRKSLARGLSLFTTILGKDRLDSLAYHRA